MHLSAFRIVFASALAGFTFVMAGAPHAQSLQPPVVQNMKTPLLLSVGDGDGTVFWHQGLELYNIARRAGKNVVVVAYAGEDHGLRKKPHQVDYHHRIQQWFDHYLKGEPAAPWITDGVSVLDRERELKRPKAAAASPKSR